MKNKPNVEIPMPSDTGNIKDITKKVIDKIKSKEKFKEVDEVLNPKYIPQIEKRVNADIPNYYKEGKIIKNKIIVKLYILMGFSFLFLLVLNIWNFIFNKLFIIKVVVWGFSILMLLCLIIFLFIRLVFMGDIQRLKNKIIIAQGDYIIATFFTSHKRISKRLIIPAEDGKSFDLGNKQIYIIDLDCVWMDENDIPNLHYVLGTPNPLKFDFTKYFNRYFERVENGENELNIKENLDVRYSADNLRLFKNDKIFQEMHRDTRADDEKKFWLIFIIVIVFCILILIIVLVLGNKQPVVNIVQNTTRAIN